MEYMVIDDTFSIIERDWWAVSNELYNRVEQPSPPLHRAWNERLNL